MKHTHSSETRLLFLAGQTPQEVPSAKPEQKTEKKEVTREELDQKRAELDRLLERAEQLRTTLPPKKAADWQDYLNDAVQRINDRLLRNWDEAYARIEKVIGNVHPLLEYSEKEEQERQETRERMDITRSENVFTIEVPFRRYGCGCRPRVEGVSGTFSTGIVRQTNRGFSWQVKVKPGTEVSLYAKNRQGSWESVRLIGGSDSFRIEDLGSVPAFEEAGAEYGRGYPKIAAEQGDIKVVEQREMKKEEQSEVSPAGASEISRSPEEQAFWKQAEGLSTKTDEARAFLEGVGQEGGREQALQAYFDALKTEHNFLNAVDREIVRDELRIIERTGELRREGKSVKAELEAIAKKRETDQEIEKEVREKQEAERGQEYRKQLDSLKSQMSDLKDFLMSPDKAPDVTGLDDATVASKVEDLRSHPFFGLAKSDALPEAYANYTMGKDQLAADGHRYGLLLHGKTLEFHDYTQEEIDAKAAVEKAEKEYLSQLDSLKTQMSDLKMFLMSPDKAPDVTGLDDASVASKVDVLRSHPFFGLTKPDALPEASANYTMGKDQLAADGHRYGVTLRGSTLEFHDYTQEDADAKTAAERAEKEYLRELDSLKSQMSDLKDFLMSPDKAPDVTGLDDATVASKVNALRSHPFFGLAKPDALPEAYANYTMGKDQLAADGHRYGLLLHGKTLEFHDYTQEAIDAKAAAERVKQEYFRELDSLRGDLSAFKDYLFAHPAEGVYGLEDPTTGSQFEALRTHRFFTMPKPDGVEDPLFTFAMGRDQNAPDGHRYGVTLRGSTLEFHDYTEEDNDEKRKADAIAKKAKDSLDDFLRNPQVVNPRLLFEALDTMSQEDSPFSKGRVAALRAEAEDTLERLNRNDPRAHEQLQRIGEEAKNLLL